jgi:Flp pilus assembly protein TadD
VYTRGVAVKGESFRVCPKCGTRNKGRWEFCVRCGEALQDVTIATTGAPPPAFELEEAPVPQEASVASVFLWGLLLVGVVAGSVFWLRRSPSPKAVASDMFRIPQREQPKALSVVGETTPGRKAAYAGLASFSDGDRAQALALLRQAVDESPNDPYLRNAYAKVLFMVGQVPLALDQFRESVRLAPESVNYVQDYATALNTVGRTDEATAQYERVLTLAPDNSDAEEDLGVMLLEKKGDAGRALPHLKRASELAPGKPNFDVRLAYALEKSQNLGGAAALYRRLLEQSPDATDARGRLAEVLFEEGKADDAIALTRAGIQRSPAVPILHRNLGALLERAGHLQEAGQAYREYARLSPNAQDANELVQRAEFLDKQAGPS